VSLAAGRMGLVFEYFSREQATYLHLHVRLLSVAEAAVKLKDEIIILKISLPHLQL